MRVDLLAVVLALAAATGWSQDVLRPTTRDGDTIIFKPWHDFFIHASYSARFQADQSITRLGRYEVYGEPAPFYHYCTYVLPASLSAFSGETGYQAVTGFWTPFGAFLSGLAAYALVTSWWGRRAGVGGLVGVLLLPDASSYGLKAPFLSYHLVQQTAPGGLYGVAVGALALWCVVRGARLRQAACAALGFGYALALVVVKAHVFLVVLPLLCLWLMVAPGFVRRYKVGLALALLAAGILTIRLAGRYHLGPPLSPDGSGFLPYYRLLSLDLPDTVLGGPFSNLGDDKASVGIWVLRVVFILCATLGAYAVAYPALLLWLWRRKRLQPVDGNPALTLAVYLFCVFGLPRNDLTTSPEELQHRPFVWVYFVFAAWTCGRLATLAEGTRLERLCLHPAVAIPLCLALLAVPFSLGNGVAERMLWSRNFTRVEVAKGLFDCAAFIRTNTGREDVIQYSAHDENYIVFGLTERRAYLCYSPRSQPVAERDQVLAWKRRQAVERLRTAGTAARLREQAAALGVRWFLLRPDNVVDWPAEYLSRPVFSSGGFRVYDLQQLPAVGQEDRNQRTQEQR